MRVVIFVFDGLRPDHVRPALMPHLARFAADGVRVANSRTIFPSETRVAVSTLVTGTWPDHHGIVGNAFLDRAALGDATVHTGSRAALEALAAASGGAILGRPTLSRRLQAAGKRHAVVSTASPGSSFLLDPEAASLGQFAWSVHGEGNHPADDAAEIEQRFGKVPAATVPNTARIAYAIAVLVDHVMPKLRPDVAIFWSSDPDVTYHYRGLGGEATRAALRGADDAFGRLVAWRDAQPDRDAIQIVVASDHGHVTGASRIDVVGALAAAGIRAAPEFENGIEAAVLPGAVNAVYARTHDALDRIEAWLRDQPWCGLILRGPNGSAVDAFDLAAVNLAHERAPDLAFTFAGTHDADVHGLPGFYPFDGDLPVGAGMHGGLHRRELSNVLILGGSAFRESHVSETPAGLIDIAPTVARLLGLDESGFDGRVVGEAFAAPASPADLTTEVLSARFGGHERRLTRWRVGRHVYLAGDDSAYPAA